MHMQNKACPCSLEIPGPSLCLLILSTVLGTRIHSCAAALGGLFRERVWGTSSCDGTAGHGVRVDTQDLLEIWHYSETTGYTKTQPCSPSFQQNTWQCSEHVTHIQICWIFLKIKMMLFLKGGRWWFSTFCFCFKLNNTTSPYIWKVLPLKVFLLLMHLIIYLLYLSWDINE